MEPSLRPDVAGGVYYPGDAHLKPDEFVNGLAARVEDLGAVVRTDTEVQGFEMSGTAIETVKTDRGEYRPAQVVLATGAWSPGVVRGLGINLPVQPAKGYSVTFTNAGPKPSIPMMLAEARVGVTPMGDTLRLAGTLELSGLNTDIDSRRVDAILGAGERYLSGGLPSTGGEVWCGMRPLTPDNLPIIGGVDRPSNLVLATGHSMTGVTLGPATGKLVAQLVSGESPIVDPAPFSPQRFQ
jgi:D-amino-acid dehydrogenase